MISSWASTSSMMTSNINVPTVFTVKFDFANHLRKIGITANQSTLVCGVAHKILFMDFKDIYRCKDRIKEAKMGSLYDDSYPSVDEMVCHPIHNEIVAHASDSHILVWDMNMHSKDIIGNHFRTITSLAWRNSDT